MTGPLQGLRVLDLSRVLAGPYCTMLLGDAGADVIKVESPAGDDTRRWGPPWVGDTAAYFLACNRNKKSIVIDLKQQAGRDVLLKLAQQADVLIENFRVGTMEKWGLGYEDVLRAHNPRLIYCNISGFGRTGPYAHVPGYDLVAQAMGGIMSITGQPDSGPTKVGVAVTDLTTGMLAAFAIMAAVYYRQQSGVGQRVDLTLLDTQVAWLANIASGYFATDTPPRRLGNAHPSIVPYEVYPARDREMVLAIGNDGQFKRFCSLIGHEDIASDPRFETNDARVRNREALNAILTPILQQRDAAEWVSLLWEHNIPCGPVNTVDQVFSDPQVLHQGMLQQMDHPTLGRIKQVGIPYKFGTTPGSLRHPPPALGEHTTEILWDAGYAAAEVDALLAAGAVATNASRKQDGGA